MKKLYIMIVLLINLMVLSPTLWADSLPDYYPSSFRMLGTIERLNIKDSTAVINDMDMSLATNLHVYTPATQFGSVHFLSVGMKVGFKMDNSESGKQVITDIWVLPDDYIPQRGPRF